MRTRLKEIVIPECFNRGSSISYTGFPLSPSTMRCWVRGNDNRVLMNIKKETPYAAKRSAGRMSSRGQETTPLGVEECVMTTAAIF